MDISISRNDLSKMLERARSAVSAKSPIAALQCALLDACDGKLTVSATDSFVSVRSNASAAVKKPGRTCVDARKIADIVKSLPAGDVRLSINASGLQVSSGKSKFKLATVDTDGFPALPTTEHATALVSLECDVISHLIAQGAYAQATDETRPFLCVALLELSDDSATLVSTDGNRLAHASARVTHGPASKLAIPARGLGEIKKLCDGLKGSTVELHRHVQLLMVTSADATLSVQLGDDAAFPPYKRLIPTSYKHRATFCRDLLMDAVKRAGLVSSATKIGAVRLEFSDGELAITAESEADAADERIECDSDFKMVIGVGANFFAQALAGLAADEVTVDLIDPLAPIIIRGVGDDGATALCMPMRLA